MFLVPPAPTPCLSIVSLEKQKSSPIVKVELGSNRGDMFVTACFLQCLLNKWKALAFHPQYSISLPLPCSLQHFWVSAHPQIIITAPNWHIFSSQRITVILGMWKSLSQAVHPLENTVGVVHPFLLNLIQKESVIIKVRLKGLNAGCRTWKIKNTNQ